MDAKIRNQSCICICKWIMVCDKLRNPRFEQIGRAFFRRFPVFVSKIDIKKRKVMQSGFLIQDSQPVFSMCLALLFCNGIPISVLFEKMRKKRDFLKVEMRLQRKYHKK